MMTLETPRLLLRPFESADAEPLFAVHQDPDVIRWLFLGVPQRGIGSAWRGIAMIVGRWHLGVSIAAA